MTESSKMVLLAHIDALEDKQMLEVWIQMSAAILKKRDHAE